MNESLPGVLGNKRTKKKYRRKLENMKLFWRAREQLNLNKNKLVSVKVEVKKRAKSQNWV